MALATDLIPYICGLAIQLDETDARINAALDGGHRRAFRAWCKRRASLAARLQTYLLQVANQ